MRLSVRERRMKCTSATKFHRKSGGAQWRDLRCAPRASQILEFSDEITPKQQKQPRKWELFRLFGCIGVGRKKGSPRDYTAGIDCSKQPTQKSRLGEPHECYSLYRIGRTQENHQLLHQDGSRPDRERRHVGRRAFCVAQLGWESTATMAWRYGGNDLQRLDLRHTQALCGTAGDGPSGEDESHYCGQEEKRCHRCSHHSGSGALRLTARLLCVFSGSARPGPTDALSPDDGSA